MAGPDEAFIREYEDWVRSVANGLRRSLELSSEVDDLVGYGYRGLLEARARYDPTLGVTFTTFAYYRVRGAMLDGVRHMAYLPPKVHARRKVAEAQDFIAETEATARAADPTRRTDLTATLASMEAILGRTSAAFVAGALAPERVDRDPEQSLLDAQDRRRVRRLIHTLPEREQRLIHGFYFEDRTLEEVGRELGMSKSWASRLHNRALDLLRSAFERDA